ncbi:MAG TPA: hypothetical protein VIJ62_12495 [Rhizomicrobium sp.]
MLSVRWFWRVEIFAVVIALTGFLGMHNYNASISIVANLMHGEVQITDCAIQASAPVFGQPTVDQVLGPNPDTQPWWNGCGHGIPSRLIVLFGGIMAASGVILRRYKPS